MDKGHEKANVESKMCYHRRNMLVPVSKVDDLRPFDAHRLKQCNEDMLRPRYLRQRLHGKLVEDDRKVLLPLPPVLLDELEFEMVRKNRCAKFTLSKV